MEFSFVQIVNITVVSSIYFKHVKVKIFSDCTHFRKSFNNIGLLFLLLLFLSEAKLTFEQP